VRYPYPWRTNGCLRGCRGGECCLRSTRWQTRRRDTDRSRPGTGQSRCSIPTRRAQTTTRSIPRLRQSAYFRFAAQINAVSSDFCKSIIYVGAAEVKRYFAIKSALLSAEGKRLEYSNPVPDETGLSWRTTRAPRPERSGTKSINAGSGAEPGTNPNSNWDGTFRRSRQLDVLDLVCFQWLTSLMPS
jgi:hypothetical protein